MRVIIILEGIFCKSLPEPAESVIINITVHAAPHMNYLSATLIDEMLCCFVTCPVVIDDDTYTVAAFKNPVKEDNRNILLEDIMEDIDVLRFVGQRYQE